jgi:hypothetical protein
LFAVVFINTNVLLIYVKLIFVLTKFLLRILLSKTTGGRTMENENKPLTLIDVALFTLVATIFFCGHWLVELIAVWIEGVIGL